MEDVSSYSRRRLEEEVEQDGYLGELAKKYIPSQSAQASRSTDVSGESIEGSMHGRMKQLLPITGDYAKIVNDPLPPKGGDWELWEVPVTVRSFFNQ